MLCDAARDRFYKTPFRQKKFHPQISTQKQHIENLYGANPTTSELTSSTLAM
jgi:hypothetical protein